VCSVVVNCKYITTLRDLVQSIYIEIINTLQINSPWSVELKHYKDIYHRCYDVIDIVTFLNKHLALSPPSSSSSSSNTTPSSSNMIFLIIEQFEHLLSEYHLLTLLPQITQVTKPLLFPFFSHY